MTSTTTTTTTTNTTTNTATASASASASASSSQKQQTKFTQERSWLSTRQTSLKKLLEDKNNTDVTFVIGKEETEFPCHRILIATISPVFRAMLYGQMQESLDDAVIRIPDIDSQAFQCILYYSYCNDPQITLDNVVRVKSICDKYQIQGVSDACDELIYRELREDNVVTLLNLAIEYKLDSFVKVCLEKMKGPGGFGQQLLKSTLFPTLSFPIIQHLLELNSWQITEEDLFEKICEWAKHQAEKTLKPKEEKKEEEKKEEKKEEEKKEEEKKEEEKKEETKDKKKLSLSEQFDFKNELFMSIMQEIKKYIRFPCMSDKYFVQQVIPTQLLTTEEQLSVFHYWHYAEGGCKFFSTERRFVILSVVSRGTTATSGWSYGGPMDAIAFQTNANIMLAGIGLWCGDGTNVVSVKIFEGDNNVTDPSKIIAQAPEKSYDLTSSESCNSTRQPIKLLFERPAEIKKDAKYTVQLNQKSSSSSCAYTTSGLNSAISEGVTFTFSAAASSPNNTGVSSGAIPCLYFYKL